MSDAKNKAQPLMTHFKELRKRIMLICLFFALAFILSYFYKEQLYSFLLVPLEQALNLESKHELIFTALTEAFATYIKLAFFIGLLLTFPYLNYQLYNFIAPGLYKREKIFFRSIIFASPILFYLGCAFAYYLIFPLAWQFFLSFESFNSVLPINLTAKISEYLTLVMRISIAFGLTFQLPILLLLLVKAGLLQVASLKQKRKYALLAFFIIAAIITPPDVISQIAIATSMYFLYELTLLIAARIK